MFEIRSADGVDINCFVNEYDKNKFTIDYLINNINDLDKILDEIGYEEIFNVLKFFSLCDENYIVLTLSHKLMTYCHQKEDEKFLEFFSYVQNDDIGNWFKECDDIDIIKLKRCFEGDRDLIDAFPSEFLTVFEKSLSI